MDAARCRGAKASAASIHRVVITSTCQIVRHANAAFTTSCQLIRRIVDSHRVAICRLPSIVVCWCHVRQRRVDDRHSKWHVDPGVYRLRRLCAPLFPSSDCRSEVAMKSGGHLSTSHARGPCSFSLSVARSVEAMCDVAPQIAACLSLTFYLSVAWQGCHACWYTQASEVDRPGLLHSCASLVWSEDCVSSGVDLVCLWTRECSQRRGWNNFQLMKAMYWQTFDRSPAFRTRMVCFYALALLLEDTESRFRPSTSMSLEPCIASWRLCRAGQHLSHRRFSVQSMSYARETCRGILMTQPNVRPACCTVERAASRIFCEPSSYALFSMCAHAGVTQPVPLPGSRIPCSCLVLALRSISGL